MQTSTTSSDGSSDFPEGRKEIVELFPKLDLNEVFVEYSHLSNDALFNLILEKRQQIPIKPGFYDHFITKAVSFASGIASKLPSWLGGGLLLRAVRAIELPLIRQQNGRVFTVRETMECSVCWENAPIEKMCFCDPLAAAAAAASPSSHGFLQTRGKDVHSFCQSCLEMHAQAALEEMPLARGGLGLRCMMNDCENPIIFHELSSFLPAELSKRLEDRCAELSINQAMLKFVERCRKCNCAVELGASPTKMQIFACPECKHKCCRRCDEEWEEAHKGVSCERFLERRGHDRLLEKRLSEAVVRCCPNCSLAFVKSTGCNRIHCKCGKIQCYICRKNDIDYDHFCKCFASAERDANGVFKCESCGKGCKLWENSSPIEKRRMKEIRVEVGKETEAAAKLKKTKKEGIKT